MRNATYLEIPELLKNKREFRGNSCSATTGAPGDDKYRVYSYATMIFEDNSSNPSAVDGIYFDNKFYSTTTSRLQNILIEVFGLNQGLKKRG